MFSTCYFKCTITLKINARRNSKQSRVKFEVVKLGFKEWLNKEQFCNSEPFPMTNMLVHLINIEQIGFNEELWNNQNVPYYQV